MEENFYLIENIRKIKDMLCEGKQKDFWNSKLIRAKKIKMSSIYDVFDKETVEYIKDTVNPQPKQCFKNAQKFVMNFPLFNEYVEGEWGFSELGIGIEHAFNKIKDKYVDITAELVLGKDVTKEDYISIIEIKDEYPGITGDIILHNNNDIEVKFNVDKVNFKGGKNSVQWNYHE